MAEVTGSGVYMATNTPPVLAPYDKPLPHMLTTGTNPIKMKMTTDNTEVTKMTTTNPTIDSIVINKKNKGGLPKGRTNNPNGRPKGSTNKIDIKSMRDSFEEELGIPFERFVAREINLAKQERNNDLVQKYILGIGKYIMQEPVKIVDVTTNGASLALPSITVVIPQEPDNANE